MKLRGRPWSFCSDLHRPLYSLDISINISSQFKKPLQPLSKPYVATSSLYSISTDDTLWTHWFIRIITPLRAFLISSFGRRGPRYDCCLGSTHLGVAAFHVVMEIILSIETSDMSLAWSYRTEETLWTVNFTLVAFQSRFIAELGMFAARHFTSV